MARQKLTIVEIAASFSAVGSLLSAIIAGVGLWQVNKANSNIRTVNENVSSIAKLMSFSGGGGGGAFGGGGGGGAGGPAGPGGPGGSGSLTIQPTR